MVIFALSILCLQNQEADYFEVIDFVAPEEVVLEVGGLLPLEDALLIATRRGEIWRVDDAFGSKPIFSLWAEGLQEPLGLLAHEGWIYAMQRGELSRMRDSSGDGRMDDLETVADGWHLSGNYHEYAFGPTLAGDGSLWMTLNKPFGGEPFGRAPWRGWALRAQADGSWEGVAAGLRSPAGVRASPWGEVFFTDNQGEWCATSKFTAVVEGSFHGHPWGIDSCDLPSSRVQHPGEIPDGGTVNEAAATVPGYQLPAVWIPWDLLGRSPSDFVWDTDGNFGPYRGQVMVGDQYSAEVFRVSLQKVAGRWQGACYPLRKGLKAGVSRLAWAKDGSLWCGMTTRGWPSLGTATEGLQRIRWTGKTPFELLEVRATPQGFQLQFTLPVDSASIVLEDLQVRSWTYHHWSTYGSDPVDEAAHSVEALKLSPDGTQLDVTLSDCRPGFVYEISAPGLIAISGQTLLHDTAWYTLLSIPQEGLKSSRD